MNRFLAREQTYGELLGSIAEKEKKIDILKRDIEISNNELNTYK